VHRVVDSQKVAERIITPPAAGDYEERD